MGGTDFRTYATGTDLQTAYRSAVSDALMEYGHDGYNGTISTTSGVEKLDSTPRTQKGAEVLSGVEIDRASKWGPALAIPVAADEHFTFSTGSLSVTLPPVVKTEWGERQVDEWELRQAAVKAALAKYGSKVHDVKVEVQLTSKNVVDKPKGRSVLRYRVAGQQRAQLFETQREALASAAQQATRYGNTAVSIEAVRYWPESNTTCAGTVRRVVTKAKADALVTLATGKGMPARIATGWFMFGIAAC